jgi:starch synthase (maltosyl-transferring)
MAATLGASYGIYGPAFELMESDPREPGSEEYLHSEKYETRQWDLDDPRSLAGLIGRLNAVRRAQPALQQDQTLAFHPADNEQILAYTKTAGDEVILCVVNLDPHWKQSGWVELPLERLGIDPAHPYQVHDLLTGETFLWDGGSNYVELDPERTPAHVFEVRRRVRTERDFEHYG